MNAKNFIRPILPVNIEKNANKRLNTCLHFVLNRQLSVYGKLNTGL